MQLCEADIKANARLMKAVTLGYQTFLRNITDPKLRSWIERNIMRIDMKMTFGGSMHKMYGEMIDFYKSVNGHPDGAHLRAEFRANESTKLSKILAHPMTRYAFACLVIAKESYAWVNHIDPAYLKSFLDSLRMYEMYIAD